MRASSTLRVRSVQTRLWPSLSRSCGSQVACGEADYIERQRAKLRALQLYEAELAAGRRPAGDTPMARLRWRASQSPATYGTLAALGLFSAGGYTYRYYSRQADSSAMKKFLEEKENEAGVVKLESGLLYKVLIAGNGNYHPRHTTQCACNYRGTLIDGTEFDSSYARGRPSDFAPEQVIKGWQEALKMMVEGDKWELYVPPHLAYGGWGQGDMIPGGAVLVFEMELVKIKGRKLLKVGATKM